MNSNIIYKIKEHGMDYSDIKSKSTPIAMVAPELKQNTDEMEISKACAVLGCDDSKNLEPEMFFRFPEDPSLRQIWTDLTGRNNWTPTDYSYMCMQHFSVDCFMCDEHDQMVLVDKAVPSQKLPRHVLEVEYIDEETLESGNEEYLESDFDEEMDNTEIDLNQIDHKQMDLKQMEHKQMEHMQMEHKQMEHKQMEHKQMEHKQMVPKQMEHKQMEHKQMVPKQMEHKQMVYKLMDHKQIDHKQMILKGMNHKGTDPKEMNRKVMEHKEVDLNEKDCKPQYSNNLHIDINNIPYARTEAEDVELLKLFSEVQKMQRQCVGLKDKLKYNMRVHNKQTRFLLRIKEITEKKKKILNQKRKKKCRILLSLQDKIKEDTTGLVLAMPMRQTDDLKNFALSVYKYSPQAYIYIRNMLRCMLPSTEVLDSWVTSGYQPRNVMTNSNLIKVVAEQSETELSCKVTLG